MGWGSNEFGQLGIPICPSGFRVYKPKPLISPNENTALYQVACGANHTLALSGGIYVVPRWFCFLPPCPSGGLRWILCCFPQIKARFLPQAKGTGGPWVWGPQRICTGSKSYRLWLPVESFRFKFPSFSPNFPQLSPHFYPHFPPFIPQLPLNFLSCPKITPPQFPADLDVVPTELPNLPGGMRGKPLSGPLSQWTGVHLGEGEVRPAGIGILHQ